MCAEQYVDTLEVFRRLHRPLEPDLGDREDDVATQVRVGFDRLVHSEFQPNRFRLLGGEDVRVWCGFDWRDVDVIDAGDVVLPVT